MNACNADGCTALHLASAWGHRDTIQLLIERGCRFAVPNQQGWTALDLSYSPAIANHLQDCARIAYEGKKMLQKRLTRRIQRHNMVEE